VVLDLETLRSADDCRWCARAQEDHLDTQSHVYTPLGWEDHVALGLAIGCYYHYQDACLHWFDRATLAGTVRFFLDTAPLLVSFNGIGFDFALMATLLREEDSLLTLADTFTAFCAGSYDLLAEIWKADPTRTFERGLNSLDALSRANGYGAKEMTGSDAPRLWAQGRYAEVLNYCQGDVLKTKALFEQVLATGSLVRGDGRVLGLVLPQHPEVPYA
jgi:hypothetical protein